MVELFIESPRDGGDNLSGKNAANDCGKNCLIEEAFLPKRLRDNTEDSTAMPVKDVPGASLHVENNQYFINYRGMNVPTWSEKNPDGSKAQPFVDEAGNVRVQGILQKMHDKNGQVLGADGQPLMDKLGMRRYDQNGNPVATMYEAGDPGQMKKALAKHAYTPLNDDLRAAYNKMIDSADKLDRVNMAQGIEKNEKFVMSHTSAFLWETAYRQTQKQLGVLFNEMGDFRRDLTPTQVDALEQMWNTLKKPDEIDAWLDKPENQKYKDSLTQNPNWVAIKSKYTEYLSKAQELKAKDQELVDKPSLAVNVGKMRECNASDQEYGRLLASSIDTRAAYIERLLNEASVKKYISGSEQEKQALENDPNVIDAKRIILDLSKMNPSLEHQHELTKKALGLR